MTRVPSLPFHEIVRALERDGWRVVGQQGGHVKLEKTVDSERLRIIVPAHKPVKKSTLAHILKHARIGVDRFVELL